MITLKEMLEQNYERLLELLNSDLNEEEKDEIKGIYKYIAHTLVSVNASAVVFEEAVIEHVGKDQYADITKEMLHSHSFIKKEMEMSPDYPDEEDDID